MRLILLALPLFVVMAMPAQAYVGPGLGLGAIGVILGLLLSVVLAFFAFVWMPIKRMFSRKKTKAEPEMEDLSDDG